MNNVSNAILGEQIEKLRHDHSMTQQQLADNLSVTRQSISKWESGECMPQLSRITQIARFFHVTVNELMYGNTRLHGMAG